MSKSLKELKDLVKLVDEVSLSTLTKQQKKDLDNNKKIIEKELNAIALLLAYLYPDRIYEVVVKTQLGDFSIENKELCDIILFIKRSIRKWVKEQKEVLGNEK